MAIRLSGMTSGLDTDSIVKAMVSSYTTRKEKYQKAQTKLEWTQDAWKSLNTKVYSLYSNISNLRFSTAYNLKKTSVSDTTKATVKAGSGAPSGTQSLKIKQMAKAGYMTGAEIKADSEKTTLAQLGYTGGDAKLEVKMGDETKSITLSASSTMNDVVKELRNAGLDANYDSSYKRFYISSKKTGVANDFTITGSNIDGASALYSLGIAYGGEKTTTGTYTSNPYDEYAALHGASDDETKANIEAAVTSYNNLTTDAAKMNAQSKNLMNAVNYGYSYATLQGIYEKLDANKAGDSDKLKLLEKLGSSRDGALISKNGDSYDTYTKTTLTDTAGHTLYKYIDSDNNSHYIAAVNDTDKDTTSYYDVTESTRTAYTDADGKELEAAPKVVDDTTLTVGDKTYKKDEADGKYYLQKEDGTADKTDFITVSQKTEYTIEAGAVNKTGIESASAAYDTIIKSMDEISAVGHRVVHGGEKYKESVVINDEVKANIEECFKLAPLHNPANMIGIKACEELMPNTPMVAVFDTAFHGTMPEDAYLYALPYELYEKDGIRKYGFHGTSHKYVSQTCAEVMGRDIKDLKISPTMMYLRSGGGIDGIGDSFGLYNFKIVSEKGQIYKDNMILSATGDKDNLRQTIVPSIYYDDSKKFSLKADGFLIGHKAEVNIRLDDTYPKKINCLGTDITINKFERNDKGLNIEIEVNDSNFSYFGDVNLDGSYCAEEGYSENNTHEFVFNIKEKDNYKLIVEPIIKYKIPIDIDFTKE